MFCTSKNNIHDEIERDFVFSIANKSVKNLMVLIKRPYSSPPSYIKVNSLIPLFKNIYIFALLLSNSS